MATSDGNTEVQGRLRQLIDSELDRANIHQHWMDGELDAVLERVFPPQLKPGNGNGGR